ncbi:MAG: hypothetical protein CL927_12735 [Deltaproteobacteria bacterium]|nr:hypothetical protein [Deltaproteobacteria bacterium]HCH63747.1 hypothetical protein [Deltaproteobacteria bacterium]
MFESLRALSQRTGSLPSAVLAGLVCMAAAAYAVFIDQSGETMGVVYPLGGDGPLWFDTARLVEVGERPGMPPMYPRMVAWLGRGLPTVAGALTLNAAFVALTLLGACFGGLVSTKHRGLQLVAMVVAPLVVATTADPAAYAWYVHPEAMITALLIWAGALGAFYAQQPTWKRAAALGLCCGIAIGTKEHGLPVALCAPFLVLLLSRDRPGRARSLAALGVVMLPFVIEQLVGGSLFAKAWVTVRESLGWLSAVEETDYLLPLDTMTEEQRLQMEQGSVLQVYMYRLVTESRAWWPAYIPGLLVLGGLLVRREWRYAAGYLLPLMSLAPAVLVWTETRHYLVVAPAAALLAVGGAVRLLSPLGNRGAAILLAIGGLTTLVHAPAAGARLQAVQVEIRQTIDLRGEEYAALMWMMSNLDAAHDRLRVELDPTVMGKAPFMQVRSEELRTATQESPIYLVTRNGNPGGAWSAVHNTGTVWVYRWSESGG